MSESPAAGAPYEPSTMQVTEYSAAIYAELKGWAAALQARWERRDDYLVLTIGSPVEDLESVVMCTRDDELMVSFGFWHKHIETDDDVTVETRAAKDLAEGWLSGRLATAVYLDVDDRWCGSRLIDEPGPPVWLNDISWIAYSKPVWVDVRRARKSDWRRYSISKLSDAIAPRSCA